MTASETTPEEGGGADVEAVAQKAVARREAFARRKEARAADPDAPKRAAERFLADIPVSSDDVVSGYRPIRTELDPTPLMEALIARGVRLCVPVIEGKGLPLKFRVWMPGVEMIEGPFGAMVPATSDWVEPTLLIAPLVGFDRAGWRLGYGGGFYDRTLARLRGLRPTRAVGFAYAAQELELLPTDATDQRLDAIVTERETIRGG